MSRAQDRQIAELETTARACEAHAPFIPLAEEIRQQVDAESGRWGADIDGHMSELVRRLNERERQSAFLEHFKTLPVEARLTLLGTHFTDAETKVALQEERDRLFGRNETDGKILGMVREYEANGRINLAQVPERSVLTVGLYGLDDFKAAGHHGQLPRGYSADRYLRAASLGDGSFKVISDILPKPWDPSKYALRPALEPAEIVRLGGDLAVTDETAYDVYYSGNLSIGTGKKIPDAYLKYMADADYNVPLAIGSMHIDAFDIIPAPLPRETTEA